MKNTSLNHVYRLVWNELTGAFVAVAEVTRACGKRSTRGSAALMMTGLLCAPLAHALDPGTLPTGGHVTAGQGSISQTGQTMTVQQSSDRMVTNWHSFDIGEQATVRFQQPGAHSMALNRVLSSDPTQILGRLQANGHVFLINASGILFGVSAQVDVGGLVAANLDIGDQDFMAGRFHFGGGGTGAVRNQGRITATPDGVVALLGPKVRNEGSISATQGTVALAAGDKVSLDFAGDGLVNVVVPQATLDAQASNKGLIEADGGWVLMSAQSANALMDTVINQEGIVQARTLNERQGRIVLDGGDAGTSTVSDMLDVSAPQGHGGRIDVLGQHVHLSDSARLDASGANGGGQIHVGGGWQGQDPALRQALSTHVAAGALLDASATVQGNGGTVVAWSDIHQAASVTRAHGTFLARGGAEGGNGGRIETSGHWLDTTGVKGSASASMGTAGLWLFDPYNVTITSASANGSFASGTWTPSGNNSTILNTSINSLLEGGTNVTVTTGSAGAQIGDITVSSAITKGSGNTDVTLTLRAANSIVVEQAISHTGGTGVLNIVLDADNNNGVRDGGGIVLLNNNLSTGGGSVQFGTGATMSIGGITTKVGGDVYIGGGSAQSIQTSGGAVTVNGEMILSNTSGLSINTAGGNVSFGGLVNSGNTYSYTASVGTWTSALAGAAVGTGANVGDVYLATITSRLENALAGRAANYGAAWIGGQRKQFVGSDWAWRWVSGPEGLQDGGKGLHFFNQTVNGTGGSVVTGGYANWDGIEPNGGGTGASVDEQYLQFVGTLGQWNDLPAWSNLAGYVKETNVATSPLSINAGAGSVTFSGAVGTSKALASLNVTASSIAINGGAVTTEGVQTYTGPVTLGSASTTLNQTQANTDFTLASSRSITNATGSAASLLIKTTGNIFLQSGSSISSSSGALNTTLHSDSDASSGGAVHLSTATISTLGGNIVMGGGSDVASGYATGSSSSNSLDRGIYLNASTLNAAGGNITLRGQGWGSAGGGHAPIGLDIVEGTTISTTGSGTIALTGVGGNAGISPGINFWGNTGTPSGTIRTENGSITLTGTAGTGSRQGGIGIESGNAFIYSTGSGAISLTGSGNSVDKGISTIGTGTLKLGWDGTTSYGSNITLSTDTIGLSGVSMKSSGHLLIQPLTAGTTIGVGTGSGTLALNATVLGAIEAGFSGVTFGNSSAGDLSVGGSVTHNAAMTWKTADNVVMGSGSALSSTNKALVMWSDADGNGSGGIKLAQGSIATQGGGIYMGGGAASSTSVTGFSGIAVPTGGATGTAVTNGSGILFDGSAGTLSIQAGGGNIVMKGQGNSTGSLAGGEANTRAKGIDFNLSGSAVSTIQTTGTGTITLEGTGGAASGNFNYGVNLHKTTVQSAQGQIHITGTGGGTGGASGVNHGVFLEDGSNTVTSASGDVTLTGTQGVGSNGLGVNVATSASDRIEATAGNLAITSRGALTVAGTIVAGGTSNLIAESIGGVTRYGLTANHTGNNFGGVVTLTGANISVIDSDTMTLGAVTSTGTVNVATLSGNLTLSQNISTSDTSSSAVVLNAGRSAAAGTASGGNIVVSGSPAISTGTGGRATLYTGSVGGSTGLTALIGSGSGRFRYNSDESASNFSSALGTGSHAVFREQPTLTVAADSATITYGATPSPVVTVTGMQNGDTSGQAIATAATVAIGGSTSTSGRYTAGTHTLTPSGATSGLGYAISHTAGMLTVNTASISAITGITASNKTYDGNASATLQNGSAGFTGAVSGDVLTVGSATGTFSGKDAANGKTVNITALALGGADAANYTLTSSTATTTANIATKTVSASGATGLSKAYDGSNLLPTGQSGYSFDTTQIVTGDTAFLSGTALFDAAQAGSRTVQQGTLALGGTDSGNYTLAWTDGSGTITPASLTIRPHDQTKTYGQILSLGGTAFSATGLASGESVGSVTLSSDGAEGSASAAGSPYSITASQATGGTFAAGNYTITYTPGQLTVTAISGLDNALSSSTSAQQSLNGTSDSRPTGDTTRASSTITPGAGSDTLVQAGSIALVELPPTSAGMKLGTSAGQSPISLTEQGNTLVLNKPASAPAPASRTVIDTFVQREGQSGLEAVTHGAADQAPARLQISDVGDALRVSWDNDGPSGNAGQPTLPAGLQLEQVTLSLPSGDTVTLGMALTETGVLVLDTRQSDLAWMPDTHLIVLGVAAAQTAQNVQLGNLKTVVIRRQKD